MKPVTTREALIPPSSKLFSDDEWGQITSLFARLSNVQRVWLSGYLLSFDCDSLEIESATDTTPARILIAYGTETGNCLRLANQLAERTAQVGVQARVVNLAEYRLRQLLREQVVIIICSTHGDGDAPETISDFYVALMEEKNVNLQHLKFAVLALGDTSYPLFCEAGKNIDQRFIQLGAKPIVARVDCDVDYQEQADQWMVQITEQLSKTAQVDLKYQTVFPSLQSCSIDYSKDNPCAAQVIENICLTDATSKRAIHHLELALNERILLSLNPGDAVGIFVQNPETLIKNIIQLTGLDQTAEVIIGRERMSIIDALRARVDLVIPGKKFLTHWANWSRHQGLMQISASDFAAQRCFLREHQIIDILQEYPAIPGAQAFVDVLRPLQPRIYDLANHYNDDNEIHILVKEYDYEFRNRTEKGIASSWLTQLTTGDEVTIYPHTNKKFHLPQEGNPPLIFMGYATGVAPYRAFLQALRASHQKSSCWLLLNADQDTGEIVYQLDWLAARNDGYLLYIDPVFCNNDAVTAFSDGLKRRSLRLQEWIMMGAHIYLCGDRSVLHACELALEQFCTTFSRNEKVPDDFSWAQLVKQNRIHMNLY